MGDHEVVKLTKKNAWYRRHGITDDEIHAFMEGKEDWDVRPPRRIKFWCIIMAMPIGVWLFNLHLIGVI